MRVFARVRQVLLRRYLSFTDNKEPWILNKHNGLAQESESILIDLQLKYLYNTRHIG